MSTLRELASNLVLKGLKLEDIEKKLEEGADQSSSDKIKTLASRLVSEKFKAVETTAPEQEAKKD